MLNQFPLANARIFHMSLGVLLGIHAESVVMMVISPQTAFFLIKMSRTKEPGLYSLMVLFFFFFFKALYEIFKQCLLLLMVMPLLCQVKLVKYTNESKQR